ncbi:GreA/GreB family elongation factor [Thalassotalea sp. LPB0316]|uniref:GreA/GreB family elongation factor n=1 Tax=Thalassotalea sp. LPB0316 TaxID=2769490 RepID=UPI0018696AC2|nr:GreA/GreB family elongation factor [Thalassotalea sp. LPB0316]QOL26073.1 GreA/GreB family elongation factor [Thalassotalea sp. LPB0316]
MEKTPLLMQIIEQLEAELANAKQAAEQARLAAIDDQSVAETQYDTLAIEAGFLAHGQSQRVEQLSQSITLINELIKQNSLHQHVAIGSLVVLIDEQETLHYFFIAPVGGGINCQHQGKVITVITPQAPLGRLLMGKSRDDEVVLQTSTTKSYIIEEIY